jgi:hypothetical protein
VLILTITETEKRILKNIHLQGCTGKCGSLNLKQRRELLYGLINKGLLKENLTLTESGIELSK